MHLLSEGFHFITHFEGALFLTVKTLFTKPGQFSVDYCNGIRKKYFKPMSFFLLVVILYLLFPFFDGLNMKLYAHVRHSFYGPYAMRKALEVLQAKHMTDPELGDRFAHASEKISKFLLFIIIPVMAFFSWIAGFRKRKYYYDNFVFSIETISFFILWAFLIFPLLFRLLNFISPGVFNIPDTPLFIIDISLFFIYLVFAAKRFFSFTWWYSILYSLKFCLILAAFIQYIYKFILFFITIHSI